MTREDALAELAKVRSSITALEAFLLASAAPPAVAPSVPPPAAPAPVVGLQDPAAFFAAVRGPSGLWPKMVQAQVDGCQAILTACAGKMPLSWAAYAMATTFHETGATMLPIREKGVGDKDGDGVDDWFEKYFTNPTLRAQLGNDEFLDAQRYCGRGYVQLTGQRNYQVATAELRKAGLLRSDDDMVEHPDLALRADVAAAVLVMGMIQGWFTTKTLRQYLQSPATAAQFENARRIINGTDKAALIAGYALKFQNALEAGRWA